MKRWLQRVACRLFHPRETIASMSSSTVGIPGGTMTNAVSTRPRTFCPKCNPDTSETSKRLDEAEARMDTLSKRLWGRV